jgi:hypothetical protein
VKKIGIYYWISTQILYRTLLNQFTLLLDYIEMHIAPFTIEITVFEYIITVTEELTIAPQQLLNKIQNNTKTV